MKAVTIKVRRFMPPGTVCVLPDVSHPEVDMFISLDDAEALIIACHPDDEQAVRDAVAIEQERPKWWRDVKWLESFIAGESRH